MDIKKLASLVKTIRDLTFLVQDVRKYGCDPEVTTVIIVSVLVIISRDFDIEILGNRAILSAITNMIEAGVGTPLDKSKMEGISANMFNNKDEVANEVLGNLRSI